MWEHLWLASLTMLWIIELFGVLGQDLRIKKLERRMDELDRRGGAGVEHGNVNVANQADRVIARRNAFAERTKDVK